MDFPNFSHENHEIFPIHRATPMAMETSKYRRPKRTTWWQSWSVASRRHYARHNRKSGSSSLYISDWDGLLYIHVYIYIYTLELSLALKYHFNWGFRWILNIKNQESGDFTEEICWFNWFDLTETRMQPSNWGFEGCNSNNWGCQDEK